MKDKTNKRKLTIAVDSGFNDDYKIFLEREFDLTIYLLKDIKDKFQHKLDLLIFTGGADVNPDMYGEKVGSRTSINIERDELESKSYDMLYRVPKLGICRGSQFLTVKSGGRLIQDVQGHATGKNHYIHTKEYGDYNKYNITSTHHQMMFPFNLNEDRYNLIAWSTKFLSDSYLNGNNEEIILPENFLEPEIVYYNDSKSLCIQGHPEFSNCQEVTKEYCLYLINAYLLKDKK